MLDPLLFEGDRMRKTARRSLLRIALDALPLLGIPQGKLSDIVVTGSRASHQWEPDSDIDLHLVVHDDTYESPEVSRLVSQVFNMKHPVAWLDIPVEFYVQPASEPHAAEGVYSVLRDRWLRHPPPAPEADKALRRLASALAARIGARMLEGAVGDTLVFERIRNLLDRWERETDPDRRARIVRRIDRLVERSQEPGNLPDALAAMRTLKKLRKRSLRSAPSPYEAVWNLVFRELRHSGILGRVTEAIDREWHDKAQDALDLAAARTLRREGSTR